MTTTPVEEPPVEEPIDPLHAALIQFTGCIGSALDDICTYGLTIGESYVPFDPDPEDECEPEDDGMICSQAWVRVTNVAPLVVTEGWEGETDASCTFRISLEVGVLRCIEIAEGGEAPSASDVLGSAMQAMTDMKAVQVAAFGCDVWDSIALGEWSPLGPMGGQYGGTWTMTVELA